jgi:hypothetical protein
MCDCTILVVVPRLIHSPVAASRAILHREFSCCVRLIEQYSP